MAGSLIKTNFYLKYYILFSYTTYFSTKQKQSQVKKSQDLILKYKNFSQLYKTIFI